MLQYTLAYAATAGAFLAIDFVWLNYAAANLYRPQLGAILLETPNLVVAGLFYLLYAAAIVVLAIIPAHNNGSVLLAFGLGAVFGAAAYGTYDITNLATLKGWSVTVTVIDIAWGALLTAVSATVGFLVLNAVARGG